jgi:flagellar assembly protein FliH
VDAAEALLGLPLPEPMRAALRAAMFQAIEELAATGPATLSLHPVDYLHLQEAGFVEQLSAAHPGLRWAPSLAFAEGDWTLDAPEAAVRHVRAELAAHLHAHLGLDAATPDAA